MRRQAGSIVEAVAAHAEEAPEKLFAADRSGSITYGEAWKLIRRYAAHLKALSVGVGDCVVVECTQDRHFLLLDLALELIGAVFVPMENKAAQDRCGRLTEETEAVLLLSEKKTEACCRCMTVDGFIKESPSDGLTEWQFPAGEDVAEILYTTGTTGSPKGIEITHRANVALAENIIYGVEMKPSNVELIPLPISHSHGLRCCYANLVNGSSMVLADGVTPITDFYAMLDRYPVSAMDISPSAALILMKLSRGRLADYSARFDYIQIGTAMLRKKEKDYLRTSFPDARLYDFYGSTESGRTCVIDFNHVHKEDGCIGSATRHAHIIVTDGEGREMTSSRDRTGLLAFSGAMNMRGYHRHPELTATVIRNGYVCTNDVGYIDEEGYVYIMGRQGDIINRGGIKIAPEEIENSVRELEMIDDCACVAMEDELSGQVPALFVVWKKDAETNPAALRTKLAERLDKYRMPREIITLESIPHSGNGKILRRELKKMLPGEECASG